MSSSPFHRSSGGGADADSAIGAERSPSKVHITVIVQKRYALEAGLTTGKQIREMANVPAGFLLHRRVKGGNEPIPDDALIEVRNGDHFFAGPSSDQHEKP